MVAQGIFVYLAFGIVVLSVLAITRRNPMHSLMFMLLLFFHIAGLYLTLNAEFLAAIQMIVYAGAILVLFLFVVLLLNLREEVADRRYVVPWPVGVLASLGLFVMVAYSLKSLTIGPAGMITTEVIKRETHTKVLGKVLYTEYLYPFEIVSLILLVAIIGAIVLAKKKLRS